MPEFNPGAKYRDAYMAAQHEAQRAKDRIERIKMQVAAGFTDEDDPVSAMAEAKKAYDTAFAKAQDLRFKYEFGASREAVAPKTTWHNGPVGFKGFPPRR